MGELFYEEIVGKNAITSGGYPIGSVEDIVNTVAMTAVQAQMAAK